MREKFTEEEAASLVGRRVITTTDFGEVRTGTTARVVRAEKDNEEWLVAVQWDLPKPPAPLIDWFQKNEFLRHLKRIRVWRFPVAEGYPFGEHTFPVRISFAPLPTTWIVRRLFLDLDSPPADGSTRGCGCGDQTAYAMLDPLRRYGGAKGYGLGVRVQVHGAKERETDAALWLVRHPERAFLACPSDSVDLGKATWSEQGRWLLELKPEYGAPLQEALGVRVLQEIVPDYFELVAMVQAVREKHRRSIVESVNDARTSTRKTLTGWSQSSLPHGLCVSPEYLAIQEQLEALQDEIDKAATARGRLDLLTRHDELESRAFELEQQVRQEDLQRQEQFVLRARAAIEGVGEKAEQVCVDLARLAQETVLSCFVQVTWVNYWEIRGKRVVRLSEVL